MQFYRTSVGRYFFLLSFCSIILAGAILEGMAVRTVNNVKKQDTKEYLAMVADETEYIFRMLDRNHIGFFIKDDTLYIGETPIAEDYTIIDYIKEYANAEITFFCEDRRAITTIMTSNGERFINTTAVEVWNSYAIFDKTYFSDNVEIDGVRYFGYYKPLKSKSNQIVGMVFAGLPSKSIEMTINQLQRTSFIACIIICIFALVGTIYATNSYQKKLLALMNYLSEIDKENFSHTMPRKLTKRKDEFGEMSRNIEKINNSLKVLVQYDELTNLYNRRATMNILQDYFHRANQPDGETFTFAIGDIDFFKKVNDTYGHGCGDEVLKFVSKIFERNMDGVGFAGRWGGEEFVLVVDRKIDEARKIIEKVTDEIRSTSVEFGDTKISVTITFGIAEYKTPDKLDALISYADSLLYKGKNNGRNQVVG